MLVSELIERLQQYPQGAEVLIPAADSDANSIKTVTPTQVVKINIKPNWSYGNFVYETFRDSFRRGTRVKAVILSFYDISNNMEINDAS